MRIGAMIGADGTKDSIDDVVRLGKEIEAAGLDHVWLANIFSFDAITTLALIGRETSRVRVGTAVTPTYPRHPGALAQQAMTTAAATNNRFTLGIGLSHQVVIENMFGMSYDKPAKHMREYLSVLMPLLRGETASFQGEQYQVNSLTLDIPGGTDLPVVVAALGPAMIKLTAEMADGTNTWMVGPKTMEEHIIPSFQAAGKSDPDIVAGMPIVLTTNIDDAKAKIAQNLTVYGQLPSYRAMLDREGAAGPADIAIVGDENQLRGQIKRFQDNRQEAEQRSLCCQGSRGHRHQRSRARSRTANHSADPAEAARGLGKRLRAAQVTERQFPAGLPRETAAT